MNAFGYILIALLMYIGGWFLATRTDSIGLLLVGLLLMGLPNFFSIFKKQDNTVWISSGSSYAVFLIVKVLLGIVFTPILIILTAFASIRASREEKGWRQHLQDALNAYPFLTQ